MKAWFNARLFTFNKGAFTKTIDKIIYPVNCARGAPMGRSNRGTKPNNRRIFDRRVPMNGAYDRGGAYWGLGKELRVSYTQDLEYIHFYRKD